MIKDFVIPLNKDELLQRSCDGRYIVENTIPPYSISQAIDATRAALQKDGYNFILDHFDTYFAVILNGNKIKLEIFMRAFVKILKAMEILVYDMEKKFHKQNNLEEEDKLKLLNVNKMLAYLSSCFICYINEEVHKIEADKCMRKQTKRASKSDIEEEWEDLREKALVCIYRWLQLPLHRLWQPSMVEDSFIMTFTKTCYKVLEQCKDTKLQRLRETIFEIFGTTVKKYNQGESCVTRIIQTMRLNNVLAAHIANGLVHMINKCGCTGLLREVIKEIDESEPTEVDSRNISIFLETIASSAPDLMIPNLNELMEYLANEHYTLRNCAIGIIGSIVQSVLNGENLTEEQKVQRDKCLDNLEEHILDINSYVRSKVLQIWQCLCCEGAIPLARQGKLLASTALRLEDKSTNVRKNALQLLRVLIQSNPYAAKLNKTEISKSLQENIIKLRQLQIEGARRSLPGGNQRLEYWNSLLPDIRKALKKFVYDQVETEKDEDSSEECEGDTNIDQEFERIRELMLNRKVEKAVRCLWGVCIKLKQIYNTESLSLEQKEESLFLYLLKTFMDFDSNLNNAGGENSGNPQSPNKTAEWENIQTLKRLVNYLTESFEFATHLEVAIPMAEKLLFSTTASDAIEACTLIGTAYQFGVAGSESAIREALLQVFHRDQSVRANVATVYKSIYLNSIEEGGSARQKASKCADALSELLRGVESGQSLALTELIVAWYTSQELNNEVLQILWEKFSMKSPDTTPLDSRIALMLITMIAQAESKIITSNLEVLIKVGLGPRSKTDLLLARDVCRALLKIKQETNDIAKPPVRYPNDHPMFEEILTLLKESFTNFKEDGYVSFAKEAIGVVYHLANRPEDLMGELILDVSKSGKFIKTDTIEKPKIPFLLLSKLLFLIGHISIKQMVHVDTSVYRELKRRDTLRELRKENKSNKKRDMDSRKLNISSWNSALRVARNNKETTMEDNGEEAVGGASDDAEAEFINNILEEHIVTGDGLLAKFLPLVLDVCQYPDKYKDENVQAAGTIALGKMMCVSSQVCEQYLQLLVTILERSYYPNIRASILMGISDLTIRFPNLLDPWMKHVYGRLRDTDKNVRSTCVRVLSHLIMKEMVRARGQVSELALCIVDADTEISLNVKQFFTELSQKGNALYNVIPDILSRLTDTDLKLDENQFQEIIKFILNLLQKEAQIDAIIGKLCARFRQSTSERQWHDFAYCLSILPFSAKSIQCLGETIPLAKDRIYYAPVAKAFQSVIEQAKKKPHTKAVASELEAKIEQIFEGNASTENNDIQTMPPPPPPPPVPKSSGRRKKRRKSNEGDETIGDNSPLGDSLGSSSPATQVRTRKESQRKRNSLKNTLNSDSDFDIEPRLTRSAKKQSKTRASISNTKKLRLWNERSDSSENSPSRDRRGSSLEISRRKTRSSQSQA